MAVNTRVWNRGVNDPGEGSWAGVNIICTVDGAHLEGVAAIGQAAVILGAGAGTKTTSVQFALETCNAAAAGIRSAESE